MNTATERRFWGKVLIGDGCWEWTAGRNAGGYGRFAVPYGTPRKQKKYLAHRLSYELLVGPIPLGLQIDHLCRNRGCVRPDHMEVVTLVENIRRGNVGLPQLLRTHCPHGHPYDEINTYRDADGYRACVTCRRGSHRNRKVAA